MYSFLQEHNNERDLDENQKIFSSQKSIDDNKKEDLGEQLLMNKRLAEDLKEREIRRLFMIYEKRPYDEKYINELHRILIALFGYAEAHNIVARFIKEGKVS